VFYVRFPSVAVGGPSRIFRVHVSNRPNENLSNSSPVLSEAVIQDQLRARIRRDVVTRTPVDERERVSIERFIEAYDKLSDPLSQEADPVHVTASGIVIGPRGVVLLKHKRLGFWLQPGGHVDSGETPWEAALRESEEETGLVVAFSGPFDSDGKPVLLHVDVHAGGRGHTHLDLRYLINGGDADPAPPDHESQEIDWFSWDDAIDLADAGVAGCLRSVYAGR